MTGADGTYDYKAMAAGIVLAGDEGMGNLLPVVEKELLHESAPVPRVPKVQRGP